MSRAPAAPDRLSVALLSHLASPDAPTGAERSLALLAEGLHRRGHSVRVVAPGPWPLAERLAEAGIEVATLPTRPCWMTYWEPRPLPIAAAKAARCLLFDPGRPRLSRLLGRWRPDVVHVNCLPHLSGAAAARAAGLPVVWHLREILPPGPRRRWFARRLAHGADAIVAVSEAVARWVREEDLAAKVTVIHNGVRPPAPPVDRAAARRRLELPPDGVVAGLFGQLQPHKGAREFIRAGARAFDRSRTLRLILAGAGPESYRALLRAESAASGAAERVHLLGPQPSAGDLVAAADVVCLTTLTPDPLPRAILEAMAAGRPVVSFRSGGAAEMVVDGETGLLVDVGDVEGLAAALLRLAADKALRERMGRAAAARARAAFSLEHHVEQMEDVLRRTAAAAALP